MKLFIDSAKLDEIKEAYSWGIIDGITTNPSLMKKAVDSEKKKGKKTSLESYIKQILKVAGDTPVSLEVTTSDFDSMVREGRTLFKKFSKFGNVYVKIPVNPCMEVECSNNMDGIKAIRTLSKEKIPINCTLIFSPEQALLAAKAGANFLSPFAGREDDFIREKVHIKFDKKEYFKGVKSGKGDNGILSGVDLIRKCKAVVYSSKYKAEILAASIRNTRQLREVAIAGADIATLPFDILKKAIKHPKTLEGMKNFTKDTPKEYKKISGGVK
jgi:transaldolase